MCCSRWRHPSLLTGFYILPLECLFSPRTRRAVALRNVRLSGCRVRYRRDENKIDEATLSTKAATAAAKIIPGTRDLVCHPTFSPSLANREVKLHLLTREPSALPVLENLHLIQKGKRGLLWTDTEDDPQDLRSSLSLQQNLFHGDQTFLCLCPLHSPVLLNVPIERHLLAVNRIFMTL